MLQFFTSFSIDKGKLVLKLFPAISLENLGTLGDKVEAYPLRAILNKDKTPIIRKVYLNEKNS